jgi:aflatoxin B1 aldehyde reductase
MLFPTLRKLGLAFYAYSPLAGGYFSKTAEQLRTPPAGGRMDQMKVFADMYVNDLSLKLHDSLTKACDTEGITVKEAALRWLMHHSILGEEDGVILGASSLAQMEENLKASEGGPLPQGIVDRIEDMWTEWTAAGKALPAWV